ncbi:MAG: hypothetical protein C4291_12260 [Candidatus Dadabacteria bacterium]
MKSQKKSFLFRGFGIVMVLPLLLGIAPVAFAHSNGHESRTAADCEKLPGTAKSGERGACLKCISLPKPHHYHPDYPVGNRCRPDNGKP